MIEIEFLGTGTSTGVPQIGCDCEVCRSSDPRDRRLRCSSIVRVGGLRLLIDCSPDFRTQMLRASDIGLDALLLTHSHYDHVGGMDDLRPYCRHKPFPVYAQPNVLRDIESRIPYCFNEHPYPGVPHFELHPLAETPFSVGGVEIEPLPVMHYRLPVFGYRIGNLAYITDANFIGPATMERICGVDTLVINALRMTPHLSHFSLPETLEVIRKAAPRRAYLIHMSDGFGLHAATSRLLPDNVEPAYDTEIVRIP